MATLLPYPQEVERRSLPTSPRLKRGPSSQPPCFSFPAHIGSLFHSDDQGHSQILRDPGLLERREPSQDNSLELQWAVACLGGARGIRKLNKGFTLLLASGGYIQAVDVQRAIHRGPCYSV